MKKIIAMFIVGAFVAACGAPAQQRSGRPPVNKSVKTQVLEEQSITRNSISSGIIEPFNEVSSVTKTGGKVIEIYKKNGDSVRKGDIVLKLEDATTEATYLKARAKYLSSLSDYETKSVNFKKLQELRREKYISEDEFLTKKTAYDLSQSNLEDARATYINSKKDFEDLTVKAEISGVITDLDQKLYSQTEKQKVLFTVVDISKMYIKTGVSVSEINGVKTGNTANLEIDGVTENYVGKVEEINPVATKDTKKYPVKISVENPIQELKKGMYAKIILSSGSKEAYAVPKKAIVVRDLFSYIFVIEEGVAREIKIERGYSDGDLVEIISPELKGKMELVVDGQYILNNKDKVNVAN